MAKLWIGFIENENTMQVAREGTTAFNYCIARNFIQIIGSGDLKVVRKYMKDHGYELAFKANRGGEIWRK